MKKTNKDNWRVVAVVRPMATHMSIASLGFKDQWGDPLEGQVWGADFEITVMPQRLGDLGYVSMSDSLASRDIEGDYQKRCDELRRGLLQHPNVTEARIAWDEEHTCSYCGYAWHELTEQQISSPGFSLDEHSVAGEPACCEAAINEFRAGRGIAPCST